MTVIAILTSAAKSIGVPVSLFIAICTHESGLQNVMVPHDGGSPSYGYCQLKEATARTVGFKGNAKDLMKPAVNAKYAAKYLKFQLERYDGDWCKATAAYNAGTYNPSHKAPGKPRNIKYINHVILHLDEEHRDYLVCGAPKNAFLSEKDYIK
jgi:soluble lytic murein transglycosylase-like protein